MQREFRVALTYPEKGAADTLRLGGTVTDAAPDPRGPLFPAVTMRVVRRGVEVSRALVRGGRFDLVAEAGDSATMTFSMLGYRTLEVDLGRLARVAGRAERTAAR